MASLARKFTVIIVSAISAFLILLVGQSVWGLLLALNFKTNPQAVPWSVAGMVVVLYLMWEYLGGRWWPRSTSETRRNYLRANPVSPHTFGIAFVSGVLATVGLAGYWIVFFQLVKMPPNVLADASKYPLLTVVLVTVMSSLVSPVVEEMAFRGYCQKKLERAFSGRIAVLISSILFMLAHANHGLYWPKLTVYFLAGLVFGALVFLTDSILTSIPVHIVGDLTFFTLVWPKDAKRILVTAGGAGPWFWVHVAQAAFFTVLTLMTFTRLVNRRSPALEHTSMASS
jgi:membrane protease YdiL (CAAX protease family)